MGFGTTEKMREQLLFAGGTQCMGCHAGTVVNVDGFGTPFTFCQTCGKLFCAKCGYSAFRSSVNRMYVCPQCAESVFIFLPLFPDGVVVEVTGVEVRSERLQSEQDIISFALRKIRA